MKGEDHSHFCSHSSTKLLMCLCDTPMPALPRLSEQFVEGVEGWVDFGKGKIWDVKNVVDL